MAKARKNLPPINAATEYKIRLADPETLKPYDKNPRLISQAAIDKVLASVREFGWRQPIVVDEDGVIIVGHTRRLAAIKGGYKAVPVHDALGLTEAQKRAYRLADNRTGEESEWDMPTLSAEIAGLRLEGFDLGPLGFDLAELRGLEAVEPGKDPESTPEPPAKPVTRPGDLWELGDHYLLCGDSTKAEDVETLMDGSKAQMTFTDPPYGVDYTGGMKERERLAADNVGTDIYARALANLKACADDKAPLYLWYADAHAAAAAAAAAGYKIVAQIVWVKNHAQFMTSAKYKGKHEPCYYAQRAGKSARWHGPNNEVTVWECDRSPRNDYHPTQKPVALAERAIRNSSQAGDVVLDLFGGSGSTMIAAEELGRRAYLMELAPAYCDVIVRRWEEFTGKKAKLSENGETFEQTKKSRGKNEHK